MSRIPAFYRTQIMEAIESQLVYIPSSVSRNKKLLVNLNPPWHAEPPIWELRVGRYRVFYDVSEESKIVFVRAVRLKPQDSRTEEIL